MMRTAFVLAIPAAILAIGCSPPPADDAAVEPVAEINPAPGQTLPQAQATTRTAGNVTTVTLPPIRGETEPGAQFAGNWEAVYGEVVNALRMPRSEDARVIADIRAMGDFAPPPYLMEMGRRLADQDVEEGAYWFYLGLLRSQYAAESCVDRSARAGLGLLQTAFNQADSATLRRFDDAAVRRAVVRRLGNGDAVFAGTTSAWWICSHGMRSMSAAMEGQSTLPLDQWYAPQAQRDEAQAEIRAMIRETSAQSS